MAKFKTLATAPLNEYARSAFENLGEVMVATETSEDALIRQIHDANALIVRGPARITEAVIASAPNLLVIGRTGVGYDTIDVETATRFGIPVVFTPGAGARAVGEAALTFMLALCKRTFEWDQNLKSGNWSSRYEMQGGDLDGKTLGIIGLGRIGSVVATLAAPFQMEVVAYDPLVQPSVAEALGVKLIELDELIRRSDIISLHCPMNDGTRGLINTDVVGQMRRGALLINLARGGVIQSLDVLYRGLETGQLGGVALDVFDPAPPDITHPIFTLKNCITSPHSMATTVGAMARIFKSMTDDMLAILSGKPAHFLANPDVIARACDR